MVPVVFVVVTNEPVDTESIYTRVHIRLKFTEQANGDKLQ